MSLCRVSHFIYSYAEYHYAECRIVECRYAECHEDECHYTECHGTKHRIEHYVCWTNCFLPKDIEPINLSFIIFWPWLEMFPFYLNGTF